MPSDFAAGNCVEGRMSSKCQKGIVFDELCLFLCRTHATASNQTYSQYPSHPMLFLTVLYLYENVCIESKDVRVPEVKRRERCEEWLDVFFQNALLVNSGSSSSRPVNPKGKVGLFGRNTHYSRCIDKSCTLFLILYNFFTFQILRMFYLSPLYMLVNL